MHGTALVGRIGRLHSTAGEGLGFLSYYRCECIVDCLLTLNCLGAILPLASVVVENGFALTSDQNFLEAVARFSPSPGGLPETRSPTSPQPWREYRSLRYCRPPRLHYWPEHACSRPPSPGCTLNRAS